MSPRCASAPKNRGRKRVLPRRRAAHQRAKEVEGQHVDQAFLGSCASGRLEDIAIAAAIIKGRSISDSLLVTACPGIVEFVSSGDRIEVDVVSGEVRNLTTGKLLKFEPLPAVLREIVECGGEKGWIKSRLARQAATAS